MAKVICTLPNASDTINGVRFTRDRGQMISDDMTDEQAAAFERVGGFKIVGKKDPAEGTTPPATPAPTPPAPTPPAIDPAPVPAPPPPAPPADPAPASKAKDK